MGNNWKVTYFSKNHNNVWLLEDKLSYNEARSLAKEWNDQDDWFHYVYEKEED